MLTSAFGYYHTRASSPRPVTERRAPVQTIICFVSDFGLSDAWVGVCHAVIHRACPQAHVVDLAHDVPPFDVRKGAATAAAGVYQLPDCIHLIVVDPGVGPGRKDLCITTNSGARLVGPDNGVLIPASQRGGGIASAIAIDATKIDFRAPLGTFHARDVLAPAAAALACGVMPESLGMPMRESELVPAPFAECSVEAGTVVGEVLEADRFGSIRFNVPVERLGELGLKAAHLDISMGHTMLHVPFKATFADVAQGEPVALIDSSGWLSLALNQGSAIDRYGVDIGSTVSISAS